MEQHLNSDALQMDIMTEFANIGGSKAAGVLSEMTGLRIALDVPSCKRISCADASDIIGDPEKIVVGVLVRFEGDIQGLLMLVQDVDDAVRTINALTEMNIAVDDTNIEQMTTDLEPIAELANIMIGAYLNAISEMTEFVMRPEVPQYCVDMNMAVMSVPMLAYAELSDEVFFMETSFSNTEIRGHFILIPEYESFKKLIRVFDPQII